MLRKVLLRYEVALVRCIQMFVLGIIVARWIGLATNAIFIDLHVYIKTADLICHGLSPYDKEIIKLYLDNIPPIQPPPMSLFAMPLTFLPGGLFFDYCFFMISIIIYIIFVLLVLNYFGYHPKNYLKPLWNNIPIYLVLLLICISNPFLHTLYSGQNSCFAILFLFLVLLYPEQDKLYNPFFLAIAAAIKYSLMTFLVPVLLLQKRFKVSALSFILFMAMVLSVGFWLNGPISSLFDYVKLLVEDTNQGFNSYEQGNYEFLYIGFFKHNILNVLFKIVVVIVYCLILYKIWLNFQKYHNVCRLTAVEWCLFSLMTLFISYHRKQDGILFLPFLGAVALNSFYELLHKNTYSIIKTIICFSFLLFWAFPSKLMEIIASWIGTNFPIGEHLFTYSYKNMKVFPLFQTTMLIMICFFLFLECLHLFRTDIQKK